MESKKGWKYKRNQIVYLKGSKNTGLPMHNVQIGQPPWGEVTGKLAELLGTHARPEYSVEIGSRWRHFFSYKGISLLEDDIYLEGEAPDIQYLDEGLFEL